MRLSRSVVGVLPEDDDARGGEREAPRPRPHVRRRREDRLRGALGGQEPSVMAAHFGPNSLFVTGLYTVCRSLIHVSFVNVL